MGQWRAALGNAFRYDTRSCKDVPLTDGSFRKQMERCEAQMAAADPDVNDGSVNSNINLRMRASAQVSDPQTGTRVNRESIGIHT